VTAAPAVTLAGEGVSHRFGPRVAVQPLDFEVSAPGVVAVTGPNGSGKSTLLRILIGLLRPARGVVRFEHHGVAVPPRDRRLVTGLATPELAFYEEFSAAENLLFAAETRALAEPADAVRVALEAVGLAARADDRVGGFSSGMKQRLRLAFAALDRPALLMLDEPGSHLDDAGREVVERLVRDHAVHGLVLIATNDPQEMTLADRRIELRGRRLGDPT
jgi:ABC-type multidrug transport system ATPase subunit